MAYTQADLDALKTAFASGHLRVQRGDLSVTYQSTEQMQKAIATIEDEINATAGNPRPTFRRARFASGF